jgi:septal ring factor EnvC (AmiA/AmiB activator)
LIGVPDVTKPIEVIVPDSIVSGSATAEAERPTASVIAFPSRVGPVVPRPDDRLARALDSLNAAMQEQRAALSAWQRSLTSLKSATSGLDGSLRQYQSSLKSISGSVSDLQVKARALEKWADRAAE